MDKRYLMIGLLSVIVAQGAAAVAKADALELAIPTKAGVSPPNAIAEIRVDGPQKGPYKEVANKTLDYIFAARGDWHKKNIGDPFFWVKIDAPPNMAEGAGGTVSKTWKNYALSSPYIDPRATNIENARISPVKLCNARLDATNGTARQKFMKDGVTFLHKNAYEMRGEASTEVKDIIKFSKMVYDYETIRIPVKITCLALDRPRVRTESETKGPPPREGRKLQPTIAKATLRVEPAKVTQMGKFLCPAELKLYGYLETIRELTGKSIFVGPHYLSPITDIKMTKAGSRNMSATYKMDWQKMGGLTTSSNAEPKKQSLGFKFNVSNAEGKVLESAEKSIQVSCKPIKVNVPTVGDGMTVTPAN